LLDWDFQSGESTEERPHEHLLLAHRVSLTPTDLLNSEGEPIWQGLTEGTVSGTEGTCIFEYDGESPAGYRWYPTDITWSIDFQRLDD
jgi:hypothetical protein